MEPLGAKRSSKGSTGRQNGGANLQKELLKGDLQVGVSRRNPNTPRAHPGPERIKVAYGKVPLRARWERELCKEKGAFRKKGAPSISLRVFCGSGCVRRRKFLDKKIFVENIGKGSKTTPRYAQSEKMDPQGE